MKKILALLLALVMVFALAACGGEGGTTTSADPNANNSDNSQASGDNVIKIGVFEPLTGDSGPGGKQEMLGMQYAHSLRPTVEINGVEYSIELVPGDNQSDGTKAATAASSLIKRRRQRCPWHLWFQLRYKRSSHL